MKIEQLEEMFPTKSEQMLAEKVLEILKNCPDRNISQISDLMSPNKSASARLADCRGLHRILSDLQALQVVDRRIDPIEASFLSQDRYSFNCASQEALDLLYSLYKPKSNRVKVDINQQHRFIMLRCKNCGAEIGARSSVKTVTCQQCSIRNVVAESTIFFRTNDLCELQSAIKLAKIERLTKNKIVKKLKLP